MVADVFSQDAVLPPGQINAHAVTRINFAFANIQDGRIVPGYPNDASNLAALTALRKARSAIIEQEAHPR